MTVFKLGIDKKTGKTISVQDVGKGLQCDCICPECKQQFVAAQGQKNEWHFRHYKETDCKGGQETALHRLAKDIIVCNVQLELLDYGTIFYENPELEKPFQTFQADVTAKTNGQNLFFEVLVTHPVDSTKEKIYMEGEHKSIEIDLRKYTFTTREDLEKEILTNCNNKRIIFWEEKDCC